jgi:tellurite resistance protein TerC
LQKYPILAQTAFILVGYVGFILIFELLFHFHVESWQKFIGVVIITACSILYSRQPRLQRLLAPVMNVVFYIMRAFARLLDGVFWPLRKLHEIITKIFRRRILEQKQARGA